MLVFNFVFCLHLLFSSFTTKGIKSCKILCHRDGNHLPPMRINLFKGIPALKMILALSHNKLAVFVEVLLHESEHHNCISGVLQPDLFVVLHFAHPFFSFSMLQLTILNDSPQYFSLHSLCFNKRYKINNNFLL